MCVSIHFEYFKIIIARYDGTNNYLMLLILLIIYDFCVIHMCIKTINTGNLILNDDPFTKFIFKQC